MRIARRLTDALRSPARFAALVRRIGDIVRSGELRTMLSRLRPRSPSPEVYRAWCALQPSPLAPADAAPFVVALDAATGGASDVVHRAAQCPTAAAAVLVRTPVGGFALVGGGAGKPLDHWLRETGSEWIWWMTGPLRCDEEAVAAVASACAMPDTRIVYGDHDVEDGSGGLPRPRFQSAWDAERVLEQPYPGPLVVVHRALASHVDRATAGAGAWPLLVHASLALPAAAVVHVPRVLYHLREVDRDGALQARRAIATTLQGAAAARGDAIATQPESTPWIRYRPPSDCTVSVVVPTRDHVPVLERCLRSILAHGGRVPAEIVVVDNGSTDPRLEPLLAYLRRKVPLRLVRHDAPFNFAQLCNAGVAAASGRVIILLNNDAWIEGASTLEELAALAARARTGAVGPLLAYPDGRIQSAGVIVGVNRTATSAFAGFDPDDPAAADWCGARRRVSAVMGACLAVERHKYVEAGGMDERLAVSHNEVDLCLRLEAAGWSNVFTPFARVVHTEGVSRGFELTEEERDRLRREETLFRTRWAEVLAATDPAYHPALARTGLPFSLPLQPVFTAPRAGWRHPPLHAKADGGEPPV